MHDMEEQVQYENVIAAFDRARRLRVEVREQIHAVENGSE
jgi:hypothetical protein